MVQPTEVSMPDWILRALGADVEEVDAVSGWSLRWQPETWGVFAAVLVGILAILSWWLYRKSPQEVKGGRRFTLTVLRVAFFALLAALLLQPVLLLTLEREVRRTLPVLVDGTGSMAIEAGGTNRIGEVGARLEDEGGRAVLTSLQEDLDVPFFSFSEAGLAPVEGAGAIVPGGDRTSLGDTIVSTLERFRGSSLAGIVLVTDGGQNDGVPIEEARALLQKEGVALYAIGVGDPEARDVAVEDVEVREVLLADDAAPVSVQLRSQGMKGRSGRLVFTLGGVEVAEEEVTFDDDGPLEVSTLFIPKRPGEYPLEVRFEADGEAGEALARNNTARASLRVVDRRLRVLLVDQAPRWEYKYLEAMLLRERRVDLSCFLFEADREIASTPGSPYIDRFPLRPEELFEYDLVILGDVDPRFLSESHQLLLGDYVAQAGGALVVVAGKRFLPDAYARTELERLLPVELAGTSLGSSAAVASRPIRLSLTELGRASVMLQLGDDPEASAALWSRLPPIYWTSRVSRAKPASDVLLVRPDAGGERPMPVVVHHRYGSGEVLYIGTDNFWRWRRNVGDRYHSTLWGQIIQRMAGSRLLTESPRVTLRSSSRTYSRGDRVRVYARLFARNWERREDPVIPAVLVNAQDPDRRHEVSLRAVPGAPGMYRAEFSAGDPGNYRLALGGDEISTLDFTVRDDNRELARASMNAGLLRDLATQTGGVFLTLDTLDQLPAAITERSARLTSLAEVELWSSPLVFALLVLLITIEWIVRKYSELK